MGTTATGLRYPEPTEPVNAGAANMKNLADDLTAKYEPAVIQSGTLYGGAVPAGTVPRIIAGLGAGTTNAGGQISFAVGASVPGSVLLTFVANIMSTVLQDVTVTVGARDARSVYLWFARAGVALNNSNVNFTFVAMVA
jgi:hypothetical protein